MLEPGLPGLSDSASRWVEVGIPTLGLFAAALLALVRFQLSVLVVLPLCGVLGMFVL